MKRGVLSSYIDGIKDLSNGESFNSILKYFFPEYVAALVVYSALYLLDASFISQLKSTSTYATIGVTGTLLHFLIKVAEGLAIGPVVLCGQYNGAGNYKGVGKTLVDAFWTTLIIGTLISTVLYFGADWIYRLYGVPEKIIHIGTPFLKLRAIGIFFTFLYFSFIAFLRGIKNTRTPMNIFVIGAGIFIFFDYVLIFGKFGFPELKLQGSALATIIQYVSMLIMVIWVIFRDEKNKKYGIQLFIPISSFENIKKLISISWPAVLDKATMAFAYIWLAKMIAPMGKCALASFTVIKDIERFAFLPAIAFSQVITFLVSNDCGAGNFNAIKSNIKKVVFIASVFVFLLLFMFSMSPKFFIKFFDKKDVFTDFASQVLPILSILVFLDIPQLILAAALRGLGDVKIVMRTRFIMCFGCFMPLSYLIAHCPINDDILKFLLIYAMFYISAFFMNLVYINRFRSDDWKSSIVRKFDGKNHA